MIKQIKKYTTEQIESGFMKNDIEEMEKKGFITIAGEPMEEIIIIKKGYKITYEKINEGEN